MVEAPSFKHHGPSNKQQAPSRKPHNLWLNCGKIVAQPEVVFFFLYTLRQPQPPAKFNGFYRKSQKLCVHFRRPILDTNN